MNKGIFSFNSVCDEVMSQQVKGVPLAVTYHPSLNKLNKIIIDKLHLLHRHKEVKETFPIRPMVSFVCARKLSSYLVRAKL